MYALIDCSSVEELSSSSGAVYRPTSKLMKSPEAKADSKPPLFTPITPSPSVKPVVRSLKFLSTDH